MSAVIPSNVVTQHPRISTDIHCVFRIGAAWQALPATAMREVMSTPDMITIPGTPPTFVGMCHVRHEFVPVLNLRRLLTDTPAETDMSAAEGFEEDRHPSSDGRQDRDPPPACTAAWHSGSQRILLILDDVDGAWAILADEVTSLQTLDISDAPEFQSPDSGNAVVGWASANGHVIQVLDQRRIREIAQDDLAALWQTLHPSRSG